MDIRELKNGLKLWIKKSKPKLVIVFGSTVTGLPGPEPDLDIAVLFGKNRDAWKVITELEKALNRGDVDLMVLDDADPIARLAACDGVPIYEDSPSRFLEFQSLAIRQYMDTEPIRRSRRDLTENFLRSKRGK